MHWAVILSTATWLMSQPMPEPLIEVNTAARLPALTSILNQDEVPLQRKLALGRAASGSADSDAARSALEAAMQEANAILTKPLLPPTSMATLVDKNEDILVARWQPSSTAELQPILLWDDSISWTVIFQCEAKRIETAESLKQLVAKTFQWTTYRLGSAGFCLRQPVGPGTLFVGYGYRGTRTIPSPINIGPEIIFTGFTHGPTGYWSISALSRGFSVVNKDIDERFPPLRERVSRWPLERVLKEIGNSRRAQHLAYGAYDRDGVLVREAVRRPELSVEAFRSLLDRGAGNRPSMAGDIVPEPIRGAIEAGTVPRFAAAIDQFLEKHARGFTADLTFSALSGVEEIDLETRAIEQLHRADGNTITGCLKYLEHRGKTVRARDAVQALKPDSWWAKQRDAALAAIQQRLQQ